MNCETIKKRERISLRQAWIDRDRKIISFHPVDSGQLIEDRESLFWEKVISLTRTGYRIQ